MSQAFYIEFTLEWVELHDSNTLLRASMQAPTTPALAFKPDWMMTASRFTRFSEYFLTAVRMGWMMVLRMPVLRFCNAMRHRMPGCVFSVRKTAG